MAADVSESRIHVGKRLAEVFGDLSDAELASLAAVTDGVTPVEFTQTYSTATATVPALAAPTTAAESGSGGVVFAEASDVNELLADIAANRQLINKVIDALEAAGIVTVA